MRQIQFMKWDERFRLNVDTMDEQHQGLIQQMNHLFDLHHANAPTEQILTALGRLGELTVSHFKQEEQYMQSIGYPELSVHQGTHASLLKTFEQYRAQIVAANGEIPRKFFDFLRFWLSSHICGIDAKYSKFSHELAA